ncbi:MAG: hypothetical protein PHD06_11775 [Bacteroidales bacterium]|nr:hypothetical protein [Bacteroidales bacterium]
MSKSINLKEVRKHLPHGAIKEIAKRTGYSRPVVSNLFRDKGMNKPKAAAEMLKAAAEIITAHKAKEREAVEALNAAMSEA